MMQPRIMLKEDLDDVYAIERASNRFPWSRQNFADSLDAGHHAWVFCDAYDVILGYAIVQLIIDEAHLLNICVHPDMQRQGLGRRILEHVIDHARSRDAVLLVLEVRRSNYRAQQLYRNAGFNEMSVRRDYYPAEKGREDAILMGLDLSAMAIFKGL